MNYSIKFIKHICIYDVDSIINNLETNSQFSQNESAKWLIKYG